MKVERDLTRLDGFERLILLRVLRIVT
jgi:hypothetical protein